MGLTQEDLKKQTWRYRIVDMDEARSKGWGNDDRDGRWGVFEFTEGRLPVLVGLDGGEPEDQVLVRDWQWVASALEEAYADGKKEAEAAHVGWPSPHVLVHRDFLAQLQERAQAAEDTIERLLTEAARLGVVLEEER